MRHRLETADVFRSCEADFLRDHPLSLEQRKAFRDITRCRTAALGGWVRRCPHCDHQEISYCSCRNRHCPKCQGSRQAQWLQARTQDLLPVPYHHIVFTLPGKLGPMALQNQRTVYGILFRAVSETLQTIALDPKHLGAKIGFLAVLHTWGQTLALHPHLHCIVPGGGLSADRSRWIPARPRFFLPVLVLSRFFRGRFLHLLQQARQQGKLTFHGTLLPLADADAWGSLIHSLRSTDWTLYSKPPFGGPQQVLHYLARYTHRVALSNRRLLGLENGRVTFRYKDYRHDAVGRTLSLSNQEFTRRFLLHILPKGFVRIRCFGLLANRNRQQNLRLCRLLLDSSSPQKTPALLPSSPPTSAPDAPSQLCPNCRQGPLLPPEILPPIKPLFTRQRSRPP